MILLMLNGQFKKKSIVLAIAYLYPHDPFGMETSNVGVIICERPRYGPCEAVSTNCGTTDSFLLKMLKVHSPSIVWFAWGLD